MADQWDGPDGSIFEIAVGGAGSPTTSSTKQRSPVYENKFRVALPISVTIWKSRASVKSEFVTGYLQNHLVVFCRIATRLHDMTEFHWSLLSWYVPQRTIRTHPDKLFPALVEQDIRQ